MNILVTGGAGFQGSHVVEELLRWGHTVTIINTCSHDAEAFVSPLGGRVRVVWGSITDKELVRKTVRNHDVVLHLAARVNVDESIQDPAAFIDVNVYGTYNILEAIREHGARLIFASTCEVYGAPTEHRLVTEDHTLRPHSPYAASKAAADRLCFSYYKTYGLPITIVRPFNIYGERQKEGAGGAAIAIFVKKALGGQPITIFGDGSQTRDYMNIDDLVRAYSLVVERRDLAGEVINFGTGRETSIKEIAEHIAGRLNAQLSFVPARPGEVKSFVAADITKARALGFEPRVSLWEGIDRYIGWRQNTTQ